MPNSSHMIKNNATDLGFFSSRQLSFFTHAADATTTITTMMSSSSIKRKAVVTPSWSSSPSPFQRPRLLQFETPTFLTSTGQPPETAATTTKYYGDSSTGTTNTDARHFFGFSPFGLYCRVCEHEPTIDLDILRIEVHLRQHGIAAKSAIVVYNHFIFKIQEAKAKGSIEDFRADNKTYTAFACVCGCFFPIRKNNALRHCQRKRCDPEKIQKVESIKLCCGRYVTQTQIDSFFSNNA